MKCLVHIWGTVGATRTCKVCGEVQKFIVIEVKKKVGKWVKV